MGSGKERYQYTGQLRYLSIHPGFDPEIERPFPVTVIAHFQFVKAAFLLGVAALLQFVPDAIHSMPLLPFLLYVAAHGRDTHGFLLPIAGLFVGFVGFGLWRLKPWARRSLIVSTGFMLVVWGHRFFADRMDGIVTLKTPHEQQTVAMVLFLDAVVFLYMVAYDDIPRAFGKRK
jgi:hypothetical protein